MTLTQKHLHVPALSNTKRTESETGFKLNFEDRNIWNFWYDELDNLKWPKITEQNCLQQGKIFLNLGQKFIFNCEGPGLNILYWNVFSGNKSLHNRFQNLGSWQLRGQNTMWKVDYNMQNHVHIAGSAHTCMYTQTHPAFFPENVSLC